eukprot:CAMPEP_0202980010 /NCGR_PEP_ID=MMETSP1396-20130829/86011_1 /ASSEMBLY_ACC=CAM_ASM_000872 /TAXON_ID= /ORGANISM="Pseudokeronopsis sp., Strain Brazil" /LENGTH=72 /DNA_ID=CAMNT_0049719711 /DNA_START=876 /DNA_END=1094 /DNA_ORIENTATION=+
MDQGYESMGSLDGKSHGKKSWRDLEQSKNLISTSSMHDLMDEASRFGSPNKINIKEWREKMIQSGFKRPQFF